MLSANGAVDHNQFEVMSAGAQPKYKSPQTMQEFQYSNNNRIDDSLSDQYGVKSSAPSYQKKKEKLNSMRKQNHSQVATSVLTNDIKKPIKDHLSRTKSVDDEIEVTLKNNDMVIFSSEITILFYNFNIIYSLFKKTNVRIY